MTTANTFPEIDPVEVRTLTFDFTADLAVGETLSGTPVVQGVTVTMGKDANASAIVGSPALDGTSKLVLIQYLGTGLDGVNYDIVIRCSTTNANKTLVLGGVLPVRAQ